LTRNVTFSAGVTRVWCSARISDDDMFESEERFYLSILPDLPYRVSLGYPYQTSVIIEDSECK